MNPEKRLKLKNVIRRIVTFRKCKRVSVSFCSLAKRGFFYNDEEDVIECHECGKIYIAWKDDINHYPFCRFDIEPFPRLVKMVPNTYQPEKFRHFPTPQPILAVPAYCGFENESHQDQLQSEASPLPGRSNNFDHFNGAVKNCEPNMTNAEKERRKSNDDLSRRLMASNNITFLSSMNNFDNNIPLEELLLADMSLESHRYNTFSTTCAPWPWRGVIPGRELARCGFYFCGDEDRVKCFKCGLTLRKWSYGDLPFERHLMNSPSCRHVKQLVDLRNPFI